MGLEKKGSRKNQFRLIRRQVCQTTEIVTDSISGRRTTENRHGLTIERFTRREGAMDARTSRSLWHRRQARVGNATLGERLVRGSSDSRTYQGAAFVCKQKNLRGERKGDSRGT